MKTTADQTLKISFILFLNLFIFAAAAMQKTNMHFQEISQNISSASKDTDSNADKHHFHYMLEDAKKELLGNPEALHQVCKNGNLNKAKLLIKAGADVNLCSEEWDSPLHRAAEKGHLEIVKLLIKAGADTNARSAKSISGWTPLHHAVCGRLEIVQLLLKNGAEVNAFTNYNQTPLHLAASLGTSGIIELLIQAGASINLINLGKKTSLISAIESGLSQNALKLIMLGANVNAKDHYGCTVLHYAARAKKSELIEPLITKGADPFAQISRNRSRGYTPLHFAASKNNESICTLILSSLYCINNANRVYENKREEKSLRNLTISKLLYDEGNDLALILECNGFTMDSAIFEITQSIILNVEQLNEKENQTTFITFIRNHFIGEFYRKKIHDLAQKLVLIKDREGKTAISVTGTNFFAKKENSDAVRSLLTKVMQAKSYNELPEEIKNIAEERIKERVAFTFK